MSEKTPVYIKDIFVKDYKCFQGENTFSFVDEKGEWCRWTVFLGDNNTGKTNLLKAIASLEPMLDPHRHHEKKQYYPIGYDEYHFNESFVLGLDVYPSQKKEIATDFSNFVRDHYEIENVKDLMFGGFWGADNEDTGVSVEILEQLSIYGYGVTREIDSKGIVKTANEKKTPNADNLFNNTKLMNFEDWLAKLDYSAKIEEKENVDRLFSDFFNQKPAKTRLELVKDVLTSEIFPKITDIRFITDGNTNYVQFKTEDGWHNSFDLGYGYRATMSWLCDFCKKMFERYPNSENPLKESAVLLIDEIDMHIHPQWQRTIIKHLSDIFPATQFIVTTHSPFIIQSMEDVNLYTLQRGVDGINVKHWGNGSFIGWKIEEILSDVMGLEDNVYTDTYQNLIAQFDKALDNDNYKEGEKAFDELMKILHPQSVERKLLDIQFSQLIPEE